MTAQEEEPSKAAEGEEPDAKRPRTNGGPGMPPLFSAGGYTEASDGWFAHSGGEWLHNKTEMAYFHLPSGQIRVVLDDAQLPAAEAKAEVEQDAPKDDKGPLFQGRVRWFNTVKGFGFIEPLGEATAILEGKDLFVHRNQIVAEGETEKAEDAAAAEVFAALEAEQFVSYHLGQTDNGRICAVSVRTCPEPAEQEPEAEDGEGSEASSVEVDVEEDLKCGFCQDKAAGKESIEDFLVDKLKLPINVLGETATCVFHAVFDGHGGPYCAEHVSTHLAKNILARLRDRATNVSDEVAVKTAIAAGFKQTEHNFLQHAKKTDDSSGSTACTMTVFGPDEQMRLRLFMANCGDSRAVLCTGGGTAVRLTEDHKPNLPAEKKRIEAADGGVVEVAGIWRAVLPQKKRILSKIAGLAVSRSFGDKDFKGPDIVSAEPEITVHEVDWDADEFVILATDGVWDVLSDKDSVALVRQFLQDGLSEEKAAEALVKRAREKESQDDCTALVVRFAWNSSSAGAKAPAPEGEEKEDGMAAEEPMEVGEEGEEEPMEDDEGEEEAFAAMAAAMAAQPGAVQGPGEEDEEDAAPAPEGPSAAQPRKAETRDIFSQAADGEAEEMDEEAAGLKRWDKAQPSDTPLASELFEGLGPTREELHEQGAAPIGPALLGGLLKDVGDDKEKEATEEPQKEAVDADMDMFG